MAISKILLYYRFTPIADPQAVMLWQRDLCESLGLKGRILISEHGINGTVGGDMDACKRYIRKTRDYPGFRDMEFKWSEGGAEDFPKLSVKVRDEIVAFDAAGEIKVDEDGIMGGGVHLKPEEVNELVDARGDDVGVRVEDREGRVDQPEEEHGPRDADEEREEQCAVERQSRLVASPLSQASCRHRLHACGQPGDERGREEVREATDPDRGDRRVAQGPDHGQIDQVEDVLRDHRADDRQPESENRANACGHAGWGPGSMRLHRPPRRVNADPRHARRPRDP